MSCLITICPTFTIVSGVGAIGSCVSKCRCSAGLWALADPDYKHDDLKTWRADPLSPVDTNRPRYTAWSLFLTITNQAAKIHTGGRWRGFLTLEPLRRVHLAAFRQIAGALGRGAA